MIERVCEYCKKTFFYKRPASNLKLGRGRVCSLVCRNKLGASKAKPPHYSGSENPSWKGGISKEHNRYTRLYRERHPEQARANRAIHEAVRHGRIEKKPCEICGAEKTHGHHEDYSKPLDVRWLCAMHHRIAHGMVK